MARLAVLASGNGSNFQALAEALRARTAPGPVPAQGPGGPASHECVLLVYDRKAAFAAERAARLGIPSAYVPYAGRPRAEAEAEIDALLRAAGVDLVALAGFMRVLGSGFVSAWKGRLVNIHPSILPAWPGAHAIARAYEAGETGFGATVHFVDEGMDTGPRIADDEIRRKSGESLGDLEARVHELEHRLYPRVVLDLLDGIEAGRRKA